MFTQIHRQKNIRNHNAFDHVLIAENLIILHLCSLIKFPVHAALDNTSSHHGTRIRSCISSTSSKLGHSQIEVDSWVNHLIIPKNWQAFLKYLSISLKLIYESPFALFELLMNCYKYLISFQGVGSGGFYVIELTNLWILHFFPYCLVAWFRIPVCIVSKVKVIDARFL